MGYVKDDSDFVEGFLGTQFSYCIKVVTTESLTLTFDPDSIGVFCRRVKNKYDKRATLITQRGRCADVGCPEDSTSLSISHEGGLPNPMNVDNWTDADPVTKQLMIKRICENPWTSGPGICDVTPQEVTITKVTIKHTCFDRNEPAYRMLNDINDDDIQDVFYYSQHNQEQTAKLLECICAYLNGVNPEHLWNILLARTTAITQQAMGFSAAGDALDAASLAAAGVKLAHILIDIVTGAILGDPGEDYYQIAMSEYLEQLSCQ